MTTLAARSIAPVDPRVALGKAPGVLEQSELSSLPQIPSLRLRKLKNCAATMPPSPGFTLVELLVVLAAVAVLASALVPALARSEPDVKKIICLSSKRQLCTAWRLYADDNAERLVTNLHGAAAQGGVGDPTYGKAWAEGWLDWSTSSDNTNVAFLINPRWAKLAPYVNGDTNLFRCPADIYLSSGQRSAGWTRRVRSVSANIGIGEGNAEVGPFDPIYRHVRKLSEFRYPSPAQTWVFLDEHPDSMNDPAFFNPHQSSWIDLPASYHFGGAAFAFGDCHAEIHKWTGSLTKLGLFYGTFVPITTAAGDSDLHWMSYHAPRVSDASY